MLLWGSLLGIIIMSLIHPRKLVSEMVSTKNIVGTIYLLLLFSSFGSIILGLRSPLHNGRIFIFVLIIFSRLLRILQLHGMD
jgi:hypothetical protein